MRNLVFLLNRKIIYFSIFWDKSKFQIIRILSNKLIKNSQISKMKIWMVKITKNSNLKMKKLKSYTKNPFLKQLILIMHTYSTF